MSVVYNYDRRACIRGELPLGWPPFAKQSSDIGKIHICYFTNDEPNMSNFTQFIKDQSPDKHERNSRSEKTGTAALTLLFMKEFLSLHLELALQDEKHLLKKICRGTVSHVPQVDQPQEAPRKKYLFKRLSNLHHRRIRNLIQESLKQRLNKMGLHVKTVE